MGFSLIYGGSSAVNWAVKAPAGSTTFPPYTGLVPIIASWFISPILTGLCAAILFMIIKYAVLKRKNSYQLSFFLLPFFVTLTVWLCVYFTLYKVRREEIGGSACNSHTCCLQLSPMPDA